MIASAHVAAGAVAALASTYTTGSRAGRIAAAFGLGLLTHVVLDAIPHSDYAPLARSTMLLVAFVETVVVGGIAAYLLRRSGIPSWKELFLSGAAGALLPDAKFVAMLLLPAGAAETVRRYGEHFHWYFHAARPSSPAIGWAFEIACTLALLGILTVFARKRQICVALR